MPNNFTNNVIERSFYESLGAQIRERREALKVKRPDLARKLGVTEQALGLYERGLLRVSIYKFIEICKTLQIEPYCSVFPDTSQLTFDFDTKKPIEKSE